MKQTPPLGRTLAPGLGTLAAVLNLPTTLLAIAAMAYARQRERRQLAELEDRMLRDIGLDRHDVRRETSKPFWRK